MSDEVALKSVLVCKRTGCRRQRRSVQIYCGAECHALAADGGRRVCSVAEHTALKADRTRWRDETEFWGIDTTFDDDLQLLLNCCRCDPNTKSTLSVAGLSLEEICSYAAATFSPGEVITDADRKRMGSAFLTVVGLCRHRGLKLVRVDVGFLLEPV